MTSGEDSNLLCWRFNKSGAELETMQRAQAARKVEEHGGAGPTDDLPYFDANDDAGVGASTGDGRRGDGSGGGGEEEVVDWVDGEVRKRTVNRGKNAPINTLQFNDKLVMTGGADKVVKAWDLANGSRVRTFRGYVAPFSRFVFVW